MSPEESIRRYIEKWKVLRSVTAQGEPMGAANKTSGAVLE
jgi:hypothetical protein